MLCANNQEYQEYEECLTHTGGQRYRSRSRPPFRSYIDRHLGGSSRCKGGPRDGSAAIAMHLPK